jgi:YD repeat-containing protein
MSNLGRYLTREDVGKIVTKVTGILDIDGSISTSYVGTPFRLESVEYDEQGNVVSYTVSKDSSTSIVKRFSKYNYLNNWDILGDNIEEVLKELGEYVERCQLRNRNVAKNKYRDTITENGRIIAIVRSIPANDLQKDPVSHDEKKENEILERADNLLKLFGTIK